MFQNHLRSAGNIIDYTDLLKEYSSQSFQFAVSLWCALADPGFGQGGGPRNLFRDFADVAK